MDVQLQFAALAGLGDGDGRRVFSFVDAVDEHQTLPAYDAGDIKSILNAAVDGSDKKTNANVLSGLSLLGAIVEQSSTDTFAELHTGWMQSLLLMLTKTDRTDPGVRLLASEILALIVKHASNFPEFMRQLSTTVAPQLVQQLTNFVGCDDDQCHSSDVVLMLTVLRHFPGACRSQVTALRRRIMNFLLSSVADNSDVELAAAKCLSLLPWVGIGLSSGNRLVPEENWCKLYAQLCGSLHGVIDIVYESYEQGREASDPADRLERSLLPANNKEADAMTPCHTLRRLLMCVQEMLTVKANFEPGFARVVPIEDTMSLVCRILNVNLRSLATRRDDRTLVISLRIPEIHRAALSLLKRLLSTCGRHMSLHGTSVLGIVAKTLQWTSEISAQDAAEIGEHPLGRLRAAVYEVLVTWLEAVHSPSSIVAVETLLIESLLNDVTPKRTHTLALGGAQLNSSAHPHKRAKKKAKRDFGSVVDVVHRKVRPWSRAGLCSTALDTLCVILCYGAEELQTRSLMNVHETIMKVCRNVQMIGADFPIPYGDPSCRKALYELLVATVIYRTPTFAPDLSACIGIFSRGVTLDGDSKVSRCCTHSLATCHLITNPHRPPMYASVAAVSVVPTSMDEAASASQLLPSCQNGQVEMECDDVVDEPVIVNEPEVSISDAVIEELSVEKSNLLSGDEIEFVEGIVRDGEPDESESVIQKEDDAVVAQMLLSNTEEPPSCCSSDEEVQVIDDKVIGGEPSGSATVLKTVEVSQIDEPVPETTIDSVVDSITTAIADQNGTDPRPESSLLLQTAKMISSFVDSLPDA